MAQINGVVCILSLYTVRAAAGYSINNMTLKAYLTKLFDTFRTNGTISVWNSSATLPELQRNKYMYPLQLGTVTVPSVIATSATRTHTMGI